VARIPFVLLAYGAYGLFLMHAEKAVSKHAAGIFVGLGLAPSDDDNCRVLAVLAYLNS